MTITLPIRKIDFVHRLSEITDDKEIGIFVDPFEIFSSDKKEFKGKVSMDHFKILRRSKLFDLNNNVAVLSGTYTEKGGQLIILTEVNGLYNPLFKSYLAIIVFFIIFSNFIIFNDNDLFILPFLAIQGIIMCLIPYFIIRRGIKRTMYEIEREFFYLTKNQ